jgi:hypothetical protein
MVEVFKTNVQVHEDANDLVGLLRQHYPGHKINFDLHDCDKILRIEGSQISIHNIMQLVNNSGFDCSVLED